MLRNWLSLGNWAYRHRIPFAVGLINRIIRRRFSCDIPSNMNIPNSVDFKHNGLGCCINASSVIGENVVIHHNVTIGKRIETGGCPVIKDGVYIGSGAMILGEIVIEENAKIGAGAIVLHNVPANKTVVGLTGHIIP